MSNHPDNCTFPLETGPTPEQGEALSAVERGQAYYREILASRVAAMKRHGITATEDELEILMESEIDFLYDQFTAERRALSDAGIDAGPVPADYKKLIAEAVATLRQKETPLFAQVKGMVLAHDRALAPAVKGNG